MSCYPLFYYGLLFLLGISCKISFHPVYFIILTCLILLWKIRWIFSLATFLVGFAFATFSVTLPSIPEKGVEGKGIFIPESVAYSHSPFGTSYLTKGTLSSFMTSSQTWRRIPCQIYTPLHKPRPSAHHALMIKGRLLPKKFPTYVLKPSSYEVLSSTYSLAEWRFQIKDKVRHQFKKIFSSKETASFLLSMVTGEIDDRLMALQFNRLGLLHLLGVSGFQFSLLALLLEMVFKVILPGYRGTVLLIALLTTYALILGNSPPIQRAWVSVTLYAIAHARKFQITPLNALGGALIWELLLDPCVFFQLGFQFSFLCTAAIFIVYPSLRDFLKKGLPSRSFSQSRVLPLIDRGGSILAFFCRETLALNLAIHCISLPLIFFHFHKFPFLSLVYNLFLPAAVSLAYLFLIPGLLLAAIPFLAAPFLKIAEILTDCMLQVACNPPALFDFQWRVPFFTLSWALLSLTAMFGLFYERGRLLNRIWWR